MTAQPRWYEGFSALDEPADDYLTRLEATNRANWAAFCAALPERNRIIMEQALGNICGECGGAGIVAGGITYQGNYWEPPEFEELTCPACDGSGTLDTPADEPVTDAALLDAYLDGLAAREPAYNDAQEA